MSNRRRYAILGALGVTGATIPIVTLGLTSSPKAKAWLLIGFALFFGTGLAVCLGKLIAEWVAQQRVALDSVKADYDERSGQQTDNLK